MRLLGGQEQTRAGVGDGGSYKFDGIFMDSMIIAAARLLATGDLLGALKRVALRNDAPALALRGIAMAQLGDLVRAKALLKTAARAFGPKEPWRGRAASSPRRKSHWFRVILPGRPRHLPPRGEVLEAHDDRLNAAHARHLEARRLLLIGHLDEAERLLAGVDPAPSRRPVATASHELVVAGIAIRRLQTGVRARRCAGQKMLRARRALPLFVRRSKGPV